MGAFAERNQRAHRLVSELAEAAGPRVQRESAVDAQSAKGLAVWHLKRVLLCCSAWSGLAQLQRERAHRFVLAGAHAACIKIATNPCLAERTKHFDIKYHWLREKVKNGDVKLQYISTHDQLADIFTKGLGERQHSKLRALLTGL